MLKRLLPIFLIVLLLAGCQLPTGGSTTTNATATMTDNEMATKVAQILTTMPSPTPAATQKQVEQPTATVESAAEEASATPEVSETPEPTSGSEGTSPSATLTPTATTTGDANDPLTYLGTPTWEDKLDNGNNWAIDSDAYSTGRIDNGTLAMTGKQAMAAWRLAGTGSLTNAYIEATMKMDKCSGKDAQGIMFRVPVLNEANRGYLFGITCDGNYFLNKYDGKVGAYGEMTTLINYTASSAIVTGANQVNRIGVLMKDKTLTLFINGTGVAQKTDSSYTNGYFGIFVKPASTIPLTTRLDKIQYWTNLSSLPTNWTPVSSITATATAIATSSDTTPTATTESGTAEPTEETSSLSDLLLTQVPTTSTTPTKTSTPSTTTTPVVTSTAEATVSPDDPSAKLGDPDWYDKLNDGKNWPIDEDSYSIGKISAGYLVMTGKKSNVPAWRLADTASLTNAYLEAKFLTDSTSCKNGDSYGIFFRSPSLSAPDKGYLFGVTCDGRYFLWKWNGTAMTTIVDYTSSSAINTGTGQVNKLGVLTVSNQIQLYVNGVILQQVNDSTYTKGYFGIFSRPSTSTYFTVKLDEMKYWID